MRPQLLAAALLLALAGSWLPPATAQADSGALAGRELKVGLLGAGRQYWPFSGVAAGPTPPDHAGLEGFEVALMDALCQKANLTCTAVPLSNLEERLQGVANGTLDLTISSLSFTPGREAVVHFVKPFYYSSGVSLFSAASQGLRLLGPGANPNQELQPPARWRGVFTGKFPVGQTLCFIEGYYALPFVLEDFGDDINVEISPSLDEAVGKAKSGKCVAVAADSVTTAVSLGLPKLNAPSVYNSPYGLAIHKDQAGQELEQKLVWALTGMMNQGNTSNILQLEQQWLVPNGINASEALQSVVDAISFFGESLSAGAGKVPETYTLFGNRPAGRKLLGSY